MEIASLLRWLIMWPSFRAHCQGRLRLHHFMALLYCRFWSSQAEKRWDKQSYDDREIIPEDFDLRPPEYQLDEDSFAKHPLPIPDVLSSLKVLAKQINAVKEGLFCVLLLFELLLLSFNVCRTHSTTKTKNSRCRIELCYRHSGVYCSSDNFQRNHVTLT